MSLATWGSAGNWVIRHNLIIGAGTGIYLGSPDGTHPFITGFIEGRVVLPALDNNLQVQPQGPRPNRAGVPTRKRVTLIQHHEFSRAERIATATQWARPNVLLEHGPIQGTGQDDQHEIYGNFFYQNPSEAWFQGEGNIAFYTNLLVSDLGSAVKIQKHNDTPQRIGMVHLIVAAHSTGINVRQIKSNENQLVVTNAVFTETPLQLDYHVQKRSNILGTYSAASASLKGRKMGKKNLTISHCLQHCQALRGIL